ncbi:MAG: hypothetical protein R3E39_23740 [Anaerolineae bacterium]
MTNNMWWLPGAGLLFFGLMIAVFPELLALMVASAFIMIGISWLLMGWGVRRRDNTPTQSTRYYYQRWPW